MLREGLITPAKLLRVNIACGSDITYLVCPDVLLKYFYLAVSDVVEVEETRQHCYLMNAHIVTNNT